jgi:hypothetical protein
MAADSIWDVGGQKMKLWGQTMLLLSPALSQSFKSLLGRKTTPQKGGKVLRMPSRTPICAGEWHLAQHKKGGGNPLLTISSAHSSPHLPNKDLRIMHPSCNPKLHA